MPVGMKFDIIYDANFRLDNIAAKTPQCKQDQAASTSLIGKAFEKHDALMKMLEGYNKEQPAKKADKNSQIVDRQAINPYRTCPYTAAIPSMCKYF
jgi:hypothetical protein